MNAQEFIFNTAPFKKVEGEDYLALYREFSNPRLSVNGYNPIHNILPGDRYCFAEKGIELQAEMSVAQFFYKFS